MSRRASASPEFRICPLLQTHAVHQAVTAKDSCPGNGMARVGGQRFVRCIAFGVVVAAIGLSAALAAHGQSVVHNPVVWPRVHRPYRAHRHSGRRSHG